MERGIEFIAELFNKAEAECSAAGDTHGHVCHIELTYDVNGSYGLVRNADGREVEVRVSKQCEAKPRNKISEVKGLAEIVIKEPIVIKHDTMEGIRNGVQATRDSERNKFEAIVYAVSSGIIVLVLGICKFCYSNGFDIGILKVMSWLVVAPLVLSIGCLMCSDYFATLAREKHIAIMDRAESAVSVEEVEKLNGKVGKCNGYTRVAFSIGVLLFLIMMIIVTCCLPNMKPLNCNGVASPKSELSQTEKPTGTRKEMQMNDNKDSNNPQKFLNTTNQPAETCIAFAQDGGKLTKAEMDAIRELSSEGSNQSDEKSNRQ